MDMSNDQVYHLKYSALAHQTSGKLAGIQCGDGKYACLSVCLSVGLSVPVCLDLCNVQCDHALCTTDQMHGQAMCCVH